MWINSIANTTNRKNKMKRKKYTYREAFINITNERLCVCVCECLECHHNLNHSEYTFGASQAKRLEISSNLSGKRNCFFVLKLKYRWIAANRQSLINIFLYFSLAHAMLKQTI